MADTTKVRVRIPPSPTGNLHVGTARTALFNELFARHMGGDFIVRIEDTDAARSKPEYEANILEGLQWLGLTWQEGPDVGGKYGPYRQSERHELYITALEKLIETDKAYYCSCPPGKQEGMICSCAQIPSSRRSESEKKSLPIKLRVASQEISFDDVVRGRVVTHTDTFGGDFVIARSIQNPLYHLAVVIDDAAMEITHVIRGEDHISNTPKHILLQQALGYPQPIYAHLPLLLNDQRQKLSKRKSETSLLVYRDKGYLPEAMLNYLALLGWNPGNDQEFFTHQELVQAFSLERVQKGGAIFSLVKLQATNRHYIRTLSGEDLLQRFDDFLKNKVGVQHSYDLSNTAYWSKAIVIEQERIATLEDLVEALELYKLDWTASYPAELLIWKKSDRATTSQLLKKLIETISAFSTEDLNLEIMETELMAWIDQEDLGRGDTLWPMRVALTGKEHSPGPFEVASVLGKTETLRRLGLAQQKLL